MTTDGLKWRNALPEATRSMLHVAERLGEDGHEYHKAMVVLASFIDDLLTPYPPDVVAKIKEILTHDS